MSATGRPTTSDELFGIRKRLQELARAIEPFDYQLKRIEDNAKPVGAAFSGSWLGYHSRVYYKNFSAPPPGDYFSPQWGLMDVSNFTVGSTGEWIEYSYDKVKARIFETTGEFNLYQAEQAVENAELEFDLLKSDAMSLLQIEIQSSPDAFISDLLGAIRELSPASAKEILSRWNSRDKISAGDTRAASQGKQAPPHLEILAQVLRVYHAFDVCGALAHQLHKAASHIARTERDEFVRERIGTNVFIGHGRSHAWKDLKDFVRDRLHLPYDEFNRVPVAGITNISHLSEMLDAAAVAFIVMTAEDERVDGVMQARMNVIHEAGLFQGRLGFTKAIVLLEEGCEEFSNIQGLGQIRFPPGNIGAAFEEIRKLLEREGLVKENS